MARSHDSAKQHFWRQVLARRQASGLSIRAYCRAHGLSEQNFYRWQRVLAERRDRDAAHRRAARTRLAHGPNDDAVPLFVPVKVDVGAATETALEVVLADGRSIRVRPGFDAATLGEVVACLEGRAC
jgi:transposase